VFREGVSSFILRNRAGSVIQGSSTYEQTAIDNAVKSLKSGRTFTQKVLLAGEFPQLDNGLGLTAACIEVPTWTEFENQGKIKLASGVNKAMLTGAHHTAEPKYDHHVWVHGGYWDGNKAEQNAGDIIFWTKGATIPDAESPSGFDAIKFTDLELLNAYQDALHLQAQVGFTILVAYIANVKDGAAERYGLIYGTLQRQPYP